MRLLEFSKESSGLACRRLWKSISACITRGREEAGILHISNHVLSLSGKHDFLFAAKSAWKLKPTQFEGLDLQLQKLVCNFKKNALTMKLSRGVFL